MGEAGSINQADAQEVQAKDGCCMLSFIIKALCIDKQLKHRKACIVQLQSTFTSFELSKWCTENEEKLF